jgi:hypothetical protein
MSERIDVYSVGICCASACAPSAATREDVERAVNLTHPTGIRSRWTISDDPTFAGGEPMPHPCNMDPGRRHWLLNC